MEQNIGNTFKKFLLSILASVLAGFIVYTYQDRVKAGLTCAGHEKLVIEPEEAIAVSGLKRISEQMVELTLHPDYAWTLMPLKAYPGDTIEISYISGNDADVIYRVGGLDTQKYSHQYAGFGIIPRKATVGENGRLDLWADKPCRVQIGIRPKK